MKPWRIFLFLWLLLAFSVVLLDRIFIFYVSSKQK